MVRLDVMTMKERQSLTTQEQQEGLVVKVLMVLHYWLSVLMLIAAEVLDVLGLVQWSLILYLHLFACSVFLSNMIKRAHCWIRALTEDWPQLQHWQPEQAMLIMLPGGLLQEQQLLVTLTALARMQPFEGRTE